MFECIFHAYQEQMHGYVLFFLFYSDGINHEEGYLWWANIQGPEEVAYECSEEEEWGEARTRSY